MTAFKLSLKVDQGGTFTKLVTWKTGDPALPVDLTGCTARMQVRASVEATAVLASLTTENGGITLGGVLGTVALRIEATATALYTWVQAVYDLEIVFGDGTVRRLLQGYVTVSPEVTR